MLYVMIGPALSQDVKLVTHASGGPGTVSPDTWDTVQCAINRACTWTIPAGTHVNVTAAPSTGPVTTFLGWSGDCAGTTNPCPLVMDSDKSVTASFSLPMTSYTLSVSVGGPEGSGTVTSSPGGIDCPSSCSSTFNGGEQVTLTATPSTGYTFDGWGGACVGSSSTCALVIDADTSVTASFSCAAVGLQVAPESGVAAAGSRAGPFTPSSFQYQLSNCSAPALNVDVTFPSWLSITLPYTTTVTFNIYAFNPNVYGLLPGTYGAPILFADTDDGTTQTRAASLEVLGAKPRDFNADGTADLLWRDSGGNVALWLMAGGGVQAAAGVGSAPNTWSIIGQRDFDGDGKADILWRDSSGNLAIWFMNGGAIASTASLGNVPNTWTVYGTGDLSGDGIGDLLWRDSESGSIAVWFMNGGTIASTVSLGTLPASWQIIADDSSGKILWRDTSGNFAIWQMVGSSVVNSVGLGNLPNNWVIAGTGDFNGDGYTDILWRDGNTGTPAVWFLNSGGGINLAASLGAVPSNWAIAQIGDYNGDGYSDILWQDGSGNVAIWFMSGSTIASTAGLGNVGASWTVQSLNAD